MKKDYLLKNPDNTERKYEEEYEYVGGENRPVQQRQYFNFSPMYAPEQTTATGASIGLNSNLPLSLNVSGMNTKYGDMYSANAQLNLMRLLQDLSPEEQQKYLAQVGLNYNYAKDFDQGQYSPMFMLGYQNNNPQGGFSATVSMDNRKEPMYAAEYRRRF